MASENAVSNTDGSEFLAVNYPQRTCWWVVVRESPVEMLIIRDGGQEFFPIFSFREEAELFAHFEAEDGWLVWEVRAEEVLQILYELPATVERVCLDPFPSLVGDEMLEFVSLCRKRFEALLVEGRFSILDPSYEGT